MKVLHYVDEDNLAWGETWIQLLKELARQGVENFAVCRGGGRLARRLAEEGLAFDTARPLAQFLPFTDFALGAILRRERPDLIHTRLSSAALLGGWWGKRFDIPVISTIDKYPKLKYYTNASMIFPCSEAVKEHMLKIGFPDGKTAVVYNPVDIPRYRRDGEIRDAVRKKYGADDRTKIILGAGRFVDWKGFEYLIEAYAELIRGGGFDDALLWLVGDGPEMARYRKLADRPELGGRIMFPGFADDIRPWLWAADLFVQPSQQPEGFSLMLLEAMASGLPSIATDIGGTPDIIVDGENGWLAGTGRGGGLADKMRRALADGDALARIAAKAEERAGWFSVSRIAEETIGHYRRVIAEAKSRAARRA